MIGDVVGGPGRRMLQRELKGVKARLGIDAVVVNAENVNAQERYLFLTRNQNKCLRLKVVEDTLCESWNVIAVHSYTQWGIYIYRGKAHLKLIHIYSSLSS